MKRYLVVSYTFDKYGNIGDEWLEHDTTNRQEAIERAIYEADIEQDSRFNIELREVDASVDTDDCYDYNTIDFRMEFEKLHLLKRSRLFNMKEVCQDAQVSYASWRQFACGKQGLSNKAYEAINRVMNNA